MMDIDWLRKTCLGFPGVTEQIQWGKPPALQVAGKMFAIASLEPAPVCLTFKCSDESFAELTERPKIIPAPYLARAKWRLWKLPTKSPRRTGATASHFHTNWCSQTTEARTEQAKSESSRPKRKRQ